MALVRGVLLSVVVALSLAACVSTGEKRVRHISEAPADVQISYWSTQAEFKIGAGKYDEGFEQMAKAIEVAESFRETNKAADLRLERARMMIAAGRLGQAEEALNAAVVNADLGKRDVEAANALVALSDLELRKGNHATATGLLQRAAAKYDAGGATYGAVQTRTTIARLLRGSDPQRARKVLEDAYAQTDESQKLARLRVQTGMLLSEVCFQLKDTAAAKRYLADAEGIVAAAPKELGGYRATILLARAKVAANEDDLDRADRLIVESALLVDDPRLPTFNRTGALTEAAARVWSMGYVDAARHITGRAAAVVDEWVGRQTMPKGRAFGFFDGAAAAPFIQLGEIELDNDRLVQAGAAFERALAVLPEDDRPGAFSGFMPETEPSWRYRVVALSGAGRAALAAGDLAKAVERLERAVAIARERQAFALEVAADIALAEARRDPKAAKSIAARYARWATSREATNEAQQAVVLLRLARLLEPEDERAAAWLAVKAFEANSRGGSLSTYIEAHRTFARLLAKHDAARARQHVEHADLAQKRIDVRASRLLRIDWPSLTQKPAGA